MISGIIYCAISPSNKKYYGFSLNFNNRKYNHYRNSNDGRITLFYTAIKKYGFDNFIWKIIEEYVAEDKQQLKKILSEREKYWIQKDKTYLKDYGYNMTMGGDGGSPTSEVKQKISKSQIGKKMSDESKRKNRDSHIGKNSGEKCNFITYIKENRKGKTLKEEMIRIYGEVDGIKHYEHWIENMRIAKLGKKQSQLHIENRSKSLTGKKRSEKTKQNIKLGWIKRKEKNLKS